MEGESGGGPFQGLEDRFGFVDIRVCFPCDQLRHYGLLYAYVVNYHYANAFRFTRQREKILQIGYDYVIKGAVPEGDGYETFLGLVLMGRVDRANVSIDVRDMPA